jgi:site-specific DNA-methyltransferase (adenine-specific)
VTKNRTIRVEEAERPALESAVREFPARARPAAAELENVLIRGDALEILPGLPEGFADLIIVDPPYNLTKRFGASVFRARDSAAYEEYLESWLPELARLLAPAGSLYVCADWRSSGAVERVGSRRFVPRNRITWEREKGRGAARNWKNGSEDIWFFTKSEDYAFNLDAVMLTRRVLAPYRDGEGLPKDWAETAEGRFRLTCPSNLWTDITVPFWSMPENTGHPAQKPEKLLAKLILASSRPGDLVFDPFMGSGSTCAVAKKLGRRWCGIEAEREYCLLAAKRIAMADASPGIQGYRNGVFLERNARR